MLWALWRENCRILVINAAYFSGSKRFGKEFLKTQMRIYALSDLHVGYELNFDWIRDLSASEYQQDALIVAGDICHSLDRFRMAMQELQTRFAQVFFVPGNHELWLRPATFADSVQKFWYIVENCERLGIHCRPQKVGSAEDRTGVWIVPLFSWYARPEEGDGSLYISRPGEEPTTAQWSDDYFIRWPNFGGSLTAAEYFLRINVDHIRRRTDAPVISFSHFLPRTELMFPTPAEKNRLKPPSDPARWFNFSRVAGTWGLDRQIRQLGARVHVYGHQHRNRDLEIEGVRYVSHCLGYPVERQNGQILAIENGLKLVWDTFVDK